MSETEQQWEIVGPDAVGQVPGVDWQWKKENLMLGETEWVPLSRSPARVRHVTNSEVREGRWRRPVQRRQVRAAAEAPWQTLRPEEVGSVDGAEWWPRAQVGPPAGAKWQVLGPGEGRWLIRSTWQFLAAEVSAVLLVWLRLIGAPLRWASASEQVGREPHPESLLLGRWRRPLTEAGHVGATEAAGAEQPRRWVFVGPEAVSGPVGRDWQWRDYPLRDHARSCAEPTQGVPRWHDIPAEALGALEVRAEDIEALRWRRPADPAQDCISMAPLSGGGPLETRRVATVAEDERGAPEVDCGARSAVEVLEAEGLDAVGAVPAVVEFDEGTEITVAAWSGAVAAYQSECSARAGDAQPTAKMGPVPVEWELVGMDAVGSVPGRDWQWMQDAQVTKAPRWFDMLVLPEMQPPVTKAEVEQGQWRRPRMPAPEVVAKVVDAVRSAVDALDEAEVVGPAEEAELVLAPEGERVQVLEPEVEWELVGREAIGTYPSHEWERFYYGHVHECTQGQDLRGRPGTWVPRAKWPAWWSEEDGVTPWTLTVSETAWSCGWWRRRKADAAPSADAQGEWEVLGRQHEGEQIERDWQWWSPQARNDGVPAVERWDKRGTWVRLRAEPRKGWLVTHVAAVQGWWRRPRRKAEPAHAGATPRPGSQIVVERPMQWHLLGPEDVGSVMGADWQKWSGSTFFNAEGWEPHLGCLRVGDVVPDELLTRHHLRRPARPGDKEWRPTPADVLAGAGGWT